MTFWYTHKVVRTQLYTYTGLRVHQLLRTDSDVHNPIRTEMIMYVHTHISSSQYVHGGLHTYTNLSCVYIIYIALLNSTYMAIKRTHTHKKKITRSNRKLQTHMNAHE